jgi:hypothetical protein
MCFQLFKSSVRIYRTFFKGINGNSRGEKEKQGVGREIFRTNLMMMGHQSVFLILNLYDTNRFSKL